MRADKRHARFALVSSCASPRIDYDTRPCIARAAAAIHACRATTPLKLQLCSGCTDEMIKLFRAKFFERSTAQLDRWRMPGGYCLCTYEVLCFQFKAASKAGAIALNL
jgi:hypothetical protein